jgi:metallophosphoesterase (TIGR00282 family)
MINVLFIGDIVGEDGLHLSLDLIPRIRHEFSVNFIIVNGENVRCGKGISPNHVTMLQKSHVDVITSGNHIWEYQRGKQLFDNYPFVLRPYNYPDGNSGSGIFSTTLDNALGITVISMQGRSFMAPINCPFKAMDEILGAASNLSEIIVVDMHAESTAEKLAFAWYLDGRVSAVIGTHTHVQTSDERILSKGTGYITDAGMTGPFDSVIGMKKEVAINRFINQTPYPYQLAVGESRLNAVLLQIDEKNFSTTKIKRLNFTKKEYNGSKTH